MHKLIWLLTSLFIVAHAEGAENLLAPAHAFKLSMAKIDSHHLVIHLDIADGYYLYRDRMHFAVVPNVGVISPNLPEGTTLQDPFFGAVVIYRHSINVPLTSSATFESDAKLNVVTQGCSETGVCYPPLPATLDIASGLPIAKGPARLSRLSNTKQQGAAAQTAEMPSGDSRFHANEHGEIFTITSTKELDAAIAKVGNRPALMMFYADWCIGCNTMLRMLGNPHVKRKFDRFVRLKINVTENTDDQKAMLERFGIIGPPTTVFFDASGAEAGTRSTGVESAEAFIKHAQQIQ